MLIKSFLRQKSKQTFVAMLIGLLRFFDNNGTTLSGSWLRLRCRVALFGIAPNRGRFFVIFLE